MDTNPRLLPLPTWDDGFTLSLEGKKDRADEDDSNTTGLVSDVAAIVSSVVTRPANATPPTTAIAIVDDEYNAPNLGRTFTMSKSISKPCAVSPAHSNHIRDLNVLSFLPSNKVEVPKCETQLNSTH